MTTIDNAGVGLHVLEDGPADGTPVLLLHGITSCVHTWDWLVPHLADRTGCCASTSGATADRTGRRRTTSPTTCRMRWRSASNGGRPRRRGRTLARRRHGGGARPVPGPDLVRAVVLEDPALARPRDDVMEGNALRDVFALMRQSVPMLQASGATPEALAPMLAAGPATSGGTFGELLHADALTAMATGMLQMDAAVLDPVLDGSMVTAFDPRRDDPRPAIVLAGDPEKPDTIVRAAQIADLAAASPDADVRVVSGAGHLIHDEAAHRQVVLDAVLEMLGRV